MTVPAERSRALVYAHAFLKDLLNPGVTPGVPKDVRETAKWLLRHYPDPGTVQYAHNLCPVLFGPLPDHMPLLSYAPRAKPAAKKMTIPFERTHTLVQASKQPLMEPRWNRGKAKALLRKKPGRAEIEMRQSTAPPDSVVPSLLRHTTQMVLFEYQLENLHFCRASPT